MGYWKKNKISVECDAEAEEEVDKHLCKLYEDEPDVGPYNPEDYLDHRKEKDRTKLLHAHLRKAQAELGNIRNKVRKLQGTIKSTPKDVVYKSDDDFDDCLDDMDNFLAK